MSNGISESADWEVFKVGLTIPVRDRVSYCVGVGAGPSEDEFREWLHRRIILSQIPFLWAQVEPLRWQEGHDLERQLHLLNYASECSPQRQVFWSSEEASPPGASERFLQSLSAGDLPLSHSGCALLLAGKAVSDMRIAATSPRQIPGSDTSGESRRPVKKSATPRHEPVPWSAVMLAMLGTLRKRLAFLWMW